MKVLLRADAGTQQGTGHVMRCLTLAEGLIARGHSVEFMGSMGSVGWLAGVVETSGLPIHECEPHTLGTTRILSNEPDWVVVDSYQIEPGAISQLNKHVRCLAIVDGDTRSIDADLYLDQNLGADQQSWPKDVHERLLAGPKYSLVRDSVLQHRRNDAWDIPARTPRVTAFMGGTDPLGSIVHVAQSLIQAHLEVDLTLICDPSLIAQMEGVAASKPWIRVLPPTGDLPQLLGTSDIVVSAAGTSAWDICTMGKPAVLISTASNQRNSLRHALANGLVLGIDAVEAHPEAISGVSTLLSRLLADQDLRKNLTLRCQQLFDGQGKYRVSREMERRI